MGPSRALFSSLLLCMSLALPVDSSCSFSLTMPSPYDPRSSDSRGGYGLPDRLPSPPANATKDNCVKVYDYSCRSPSIVELPDLMFLVLPTQTVRGAFLNITVSRPWVKLNVTSSGDSSVIVYPSMCSSVGSVCLIKFDFSALLNSPITNSTCSSTGCILLEMDYGSTKGIAEGTVNRFSINITITDSSDRSCSLNLPWFFRESYFGLDKSMDIDSLQIRIADIDYVFLIPSLIAVTGCFCYALFLKYSQYFHNRDIRAELKVCVTVPKTVMTVSYFLCQFIKMHVV
jgi:hypothetical protein